MKKIFTMGLGLFIGLAMMAEPFAVRVNGTTDYAATNTGQQDYQGRVQYAVQGVALKAGDKLTCYDAGNNVAWNIAKLDEYGAYQSFATGSDALTCNVAGTYNIYIKMKHNDDMWYIEEANGGGGDNPGGGGGDNPGGGETGQAYWYWKGEVDGVNIENEMDGGIFDCGLSSIEVEQQAYIFIVYQVKGVAGVQYMTDGWQGKDKQHVTMLKNGNDKLYIPAGNYTLYLYDNGNGTVELSYVELSNKSLMACSGEEAIETTTVQEKARKVFVDGQLRIVRGDKTFDATGRQL
ncbi:MAG: hypothetical protein IJQ84_02995 [Paludibacteraceae bacterium]|nr:hypothetical protein [Paludibacteraceae bacterium]